MVTRDDFVAFIILILFVWLCFWLIIKIFRLIKKLLFPSKVKSLKTPNNEIHQPAEKTESIKPPTILSDLIKPGFPAKIYTLFFMENALVFTKTGRGSTDISGTQRAYHGGYGVTANIASGIGKLFDSFLSNKRGERAAQLASYNSTEMVAADKYNFLIPYTKVKQVQIRKPGWLGEMKIIFIADREYKFRVNTHSDYLFNYYIKTLTGFLPDKVIQL